MAAERPEFGASPTPPAPRRSGTPVRPRRVPPPVARRPPDVHPPQASGAATSTGSAGAGLLTYSTRRSLRPADAWGRVKHLSFLLACVISLLVGAAAVAGWWAGRSQEWHFAWIQREQYDELIVSRGKFLFQEVWAWRRGMAPGRSRLEKKSIHPPSDLVEDFNWAEEPFEFAGFAAGHTVVADVVLVVPFWFVLLASVPLPLWWGVSRVRRRRLGRPGLMQGK